MKVKRVCDGGDVIVRFRTIYKQCSRVGCHDETALC